MDGGLMMVLTAQAAYITAYVLPKVGLAPDMFSDVFYGATNILAGAVIKALPVLMLGFMTMFRARQATSKFAEYVGYGLILGSMGDLFLDLEEGNPSFFIMGLGAFLMGHAWYIAAFLTAPRRAHSIPLLLVCVVYPAILLTLLHAHVPSDMLVPVGVYAAVIATMGYTAAIRADVPPLHYNLTLAGAVLFVVSDSLLAWNRFRSPVPHAKLFVMLTYYAAQTLTAVGVPSLVAHEGHVARVAAAAPAAEGKAAAGSKAVKEGAAPASSGRKGKKGGKDA